VQNGRLIHHAGTAAQGLLSWYRDPLPTNCVADWVCEGHKQKGYHNLAVFYESCTANCLFCQNWHFRRSILSKNKSISAQKLASVANSQTFCVCYFGCDQASQMPHALAASEYFAQKGIRICWEKNGMMNPKYLDRAVALSFQTGGCIKFDLKAFDEEVHFALTGTSNKPVLENLARAAERFNERPKLPLVIASTLLVQGYVEVEQVRKIAEHLVSVNPEIPYPLLAFDPNFVMSDLPCTSTQHALEAEKAARNTGLINVRVGNQHLLV
jgi:pyruvate formate lyase activating enzyme